MRPVKVLLFSIRVRVARESLEMVWTQNASWEGNGLLEGLLVLIMGRSTSCAKGVSGGMAIGSWRGAAINLRVPWKSGAMVRGKTWIRLVKVEALPKMKPKVFGGRGPVTMLSIRVAPSWGVSMTVEAAPSSKPGLWGDLQMRLATDWKVDL